MGDDYMQWKPDSTSGIPIYKQIAHHYENLIIKGELLAGSSMPTERVLARELGVNRSTVATAYAELRASGLVISTQGSGTKVSEHLWDVYPKNMLNWNRYTGISFLPTQSISKRIREVSRDPNVINLVNSGVSPDLYPIDTLQNMLQNIKLTVEFGYSKILGDRSFREVLSTHLKDQYEINAHPEEILITSGAQQAFLLLTHCLLNPGDAVAIEYPSYTYTLKFFASSGIRMVRLPLDHEGLLPEEIRSLYRNHRVRMVFTNPTYQNPTGTILGIERRRQLLQICEELQIPIVEIDFMNPLTHPGHVPPPPPLIAMNDGGLVIHIGSLSDTVAPGMRIGWVVASKAVLERLADAKHQMDLGTSAISQQMALEFINRGHWKTNVMKLQENLKSRKMVMENALRQHVGDRIKWIEVHGGGTLWCELQNAPNDRDLLEACIQEGVLVVPGTVYGAEHGFVRLAFAHQKEDKIEEGIQRFARAISTFK